LSKYKCKCEDCSKHGGGEEGLPIWMQTFADMMTLLFAFFVLLYSMSTPDPVKYAAFANSQATQTGGSTDMEMPHEPLKDQSEIKQELEQLIEEMDMQDKAKVTQDPRGVALELDGDVCFGSGSVTLRDELKQTLDKASAELMLNPKDLRSLLIEGHTDNQDPTGKIAERYPTNWELSSARAANVVNYLIFKEVMPGRLTASGYAHRWPAGATWGEVRSGKVDDNFISEKNATTDQRTNNRRIKIIFGVK
jgi:chemotaxis protein MotB